MIGFLFFERVCQILRACRISLSLSPSGEGDRARLRYFAGLEGVDDFEGLDSHGASSRLDFVFWGPLLEHTCPLSLFFFS